MHLLAADAGNSNITFGLFEASNLVASFFTPRSTASEDTLADYLSRNLAASGVTTAGTIEAVVGSVGQGTDELLSVLESVTGRTPLLATTTAPQLGMRLHYPDPATLGIDRLANALAAYEWLHSAAIVVDLGTATQFDCVSQAGEFVGGAICAGAQLSLDALSNRSSRLPITVFSRASTVLATDTRTALMSGAFYGQAALVDGMVERLTNAMADTCTVVATGGFASLVAPACSRVNHIRPDLTLQGLRLIWERVSRG